VSFGTEQKATWKLSSAVADLVVWARLLKLDGRTAQAVDAFGFEPGSPELESELARIKPVEVSPDEVFAQLGAEPDPPE
jgi:hypothetical protein